MERIRHIKDSVRLGTDLSSGESEVGFIDITDQASIECKSNNADYDVQISPDGSNYFTISSESTTADQTIVTDLSQYSALDARVANISAGEGIVNFIDLLRNKLTDPIGKTFSSLNSILVDESGDITSDSIDIVFTEKVSVYVRITGTPTSLDVVQEISKDGTNFSTIDKRTINAATSFVVPFYNQGYKFIRTVISNSSGSFGLYSSIFYQSKR
jgi:hypothetical protein